MSLSFQKRAACIALIAMLFSALSPAMAAGLFADRPDILRHMLALPAPAAEQAQDDDCPHETEQAGHHGNPGTGSSDQGNQGEHARHGIYCSFCLAASSVAAVPSDSGAPALCYTAGAEVFSAGQVRPPLAVPVHGFQSRGPPFAIR